LYSIQRRRRAGRSPGRSASKSRTPVAPYRYGSVTIQGEEFSPKFYDALVREVASVRLWTVHTFDPHGPAPDRKAGMVGWKATASDWLVHLSFCSIPTSFDSRRRKNSSKRFRSSIIPSSHAFAERRPMMRANFALATAHLRTSNWSRRRERISGAGSSNGTLKINFTAWTALRARRSAPNKKLFVRAMKGYVYAVQRLGGIGDFWSWIAPPRGWRMWLIFPKIFRDDFVRSNPIPSRIAVFPGLEIIRAHGRRFCRKTILKSLNEYLSPEFQGIGCY